MPRPTQRLSDLSLAASCSKSRKFKLLLQVLLPVLAGRLDRVPTIRTQLTTCQGILGTHVSSISRDG